MNTCPPDTRGGQESIAFILDTPALLAAARAAGYAEATRATTIVTPPSDGEVDGIGMCSECATAVHKAKRVGAAAARGELTIEII